MTCAVRDEVNAAHAVVNVAENAITLEQHVEQRLLLFGQCICTVRPRSVGSNATDEQMVCETAFAFTWRSIWCQQAALGAKESGLLWLSQEDQPKILAENWVCQRCSHRIWYRHQKLCEPVTETAAAAHHLLSHELPELAGLGMEGLRPARLRPGLAVIHADQLAVVLPRP